MDLRSTLALGATLISLVLFALTILVFRFLPRLDRQKAFRSRTRLRCLNRRRSYAYHGPIPPSTVPVGCLVKNLRVFVSSPADCQSPLQRDQRSNHSAGLGSCDNMVVGNVLLQTTPGSCRQSAVGYRPARVGHHFDWKPLFRIANARSENAGFVSSVPARIGSLEIADLAGPDARPHARSWDNLKIAQEEFAGLLQGR